MYSKWKQLANKRITNVCLKRLSGYVNNKHESLKTKSIVIWNNFCTKPKKNSLFREILEHSAKVLNMRVQKQYYSTRISGLDHGITERVWS